MPIYEYEPIEPRKTCAKCTSRFEIIQGVDEEPLSRCPYCGQWVRKVISWCRSAIVEISDEHIQVDKRISEYERKGIWSRAAELADTHSEKVGDHDMKMRALDDYKKAGYDVGTLEKHAKANSD